jgi:hypothetical protein
MGDTTVSQWFIVHVGTFKVSEAFPADFYPEMQS